MRAKVLFPTATLPATADHVGHLGGDRAEERRRYLVQILRGGHVEVQQPGERQVDVDDLAQIDRSLMPRKASTSLP